ncbi:MAG: NADH-quinone oxidoreductase subunit N [Ardenticatenaceae bacterium]|nr:NADH-quinone oxidoreductase subunit N [Ardenticatenaceae bacterium]
MITSYLAILPEILLIILAAIVLVYGRHPKGDRKRGVGLLSSWGVFVVLLVTAGLSFAGVPGEVPQEIWGGMFRNDAFTLVFRTMFVMAALVTCMLTVDVPRLQHGEWYALVMLATVGFNLMAAAGDMIILYLALETASISFYVLSGYATDGRRSPEAGIKYFVYGAFASAVMLYGLSFLYGITGETNISLLTQAVLGNISQPMLLLSTILVVAGFGFKVSAVPFHFWSPDVYEGAPTSTTAILSTASKAAGFAVFLRLFMSGAVGNPSNQNWWVMVVVMSILSMVLGNMAALWQTNIKRLLAYSGIAQAGYLLIGLVTYSVDGTGSILFYLYMYVFTNIAAFGVVILLSRVTGSDEIEDLNGLSRRSPYLAIVMLLALLSLGGIPPAAGFFGKLFIFRAAVEAGFWWLALIGLINAFIALFYYLSVAKHMYLYRSDDEEQPIPVSRAAALALGICTLGILYLGIVPSAVFDWTRLAAQVFF